VFIYIIIVICVKKSSAEKIPAAGQGGSWAAVEVFIKVRLSPEFGKGGKRGQKKGGLPWSPIPLAFLNPKFPVPSGKGMEQKEKVFY